jgi:hypothetical protein
MVRTFLFTLLLLSAVFTSCKRSAAPDDTENAQEQSIDKSDSMPQDHTGVSGDSAKNTPGMNIGK